MGLFELILLSVALAMDAFAVSICKGLSSKESTFKGSIICGIWFGVFQALMPMIGYLVGFRFEKWISIVAPWVAFILLAILGINMIREAFSPEEEAKAGLDVKTMFVMAIATSIDALAVGITFVAIPVEVLDKGRMINVVFAVSLIGVITFVISSLGVKIGSIFGTRYRAGSEVMGGTILIFIGFHSIIEALDTTGALDNTGNIFGMLVPLLGTVMGAALVYSGKSKISENLRIILTGATSGIMFSISVWGMIEPAAHGLKDSYFGSGITLFICFAVGIGLQYLLDLFVPHTHALVKITEGPKSNLKDDVKTMLSEVIHHVPEGIALGAIYAGHCMEADWIAAPLALVLAVSIAVQNLPEALFVSLPLKNQGTHTGKAFFMGVVSGVPVPLLGVITLLIALLFPTSLPYIMGAAGGAIIYNTIEEIPQMVSKGENDKAAFSFVISFGLVMFLIFA